MASVSLTAKTAEFKFYAPAAKKVIVAGSFNNWSPKSILAKKDTKGTWSAKVSLKPGRYEYKFLVDGAWLTDPRCKNYTSNPYGGQNCVIEIK